MIVHTLRPKLSMQHTGMYVCMLFLRKEVVYGFEPTKEVLVWHTVPVPAVIVPMIADC